MNIRNIKDRANELLRNCRPQFIRILTIMMAVGLFRTLFSNSQNSFLRYIYYMIALLFIAFEHGYIVSTLKIVRNNHQSLEDEDAFVGFGRFRQLFPTYFLTGLLIAGVMIVVIIIIIIIFVLFTTSMPSQSLEIMNQIVFLQGDVIAQLRMIMTYFPSFLILILFMFLIVLTVIVILSFYLFAVPYLLEQYQMTGWKAIKESFSFMKGHVFELFKLNLSFVGWIILIAFIESLLAEFLSFIPFVGAILAIVISSLCAIYTYYPQYLVSQTIFFEEIAYYRYGQSRFKSNQFKEGMNDVE